MATGELLRKTVAEFFEVDESQIGPSFSLQGRAQSSIGRAALDAAIRRRVGLTSQAVYSAKTYGELEADLAPGSAQVSTVAPSPPRPQAPAGPSAPVSCGIDIEQIDNLPAAADHWEDAFYRSVFTPAEIAYCLTQEAPALHFAARWCAKEALKKCDAGLAGEGLNTLEVALEPSGAPYLVHHSAGSARRLPHALSLSHTPRAAVAVVVKVDLPTPVRVRPTAPVPVISPAPEPKGRGAGLTIMLSLLALGVAIVALVLPYLGGSK